MEMEGASTNFLSDYIVFHNTHTTDDSAYCDIECVYVSEPKLHKSYHKFSCLSCLFSSLVQSHRPVSMAMEPCLLYIITQ